MHRLQRRFTSLTFTGAASCYSSRASSLPWAQLSQSNPATGMFFGQMRPVHSTPKLLNSTTDSLLDDLDSLMDDLGIEDTTSSSDKKNEEKPKEKETPAENPTPSRPKDKHEADKINPDTEKKVIRKERKSEEGLQQQEKEVNKKTAMSVETIRNLDMPQARAAMDSLGEEKQLLMAAVEKELVEVTDLKQRQKQRLPRMHKEKSEISGQPEGSAFPLARGESLENLQIFQQLPIAERKKGGSAKEVPLDPVVVTKVSHVAKLSLVGELLKVPTEVEREEASGTHQQQDFVSLSIKAGSDEFTVRCYGAPFLNYTRQALRAGDLLHIVGDLTLARSGSPIIRVEESGGTLTLVYGEPDAEGV